MAIRSCEREREHEEAAARARETEGSKEELERLCGIFRMLAEPSRMKIVLALLQGEMCVYHLAEVTKGSVSGVSHQLRVLRENKIVKTERFGKNIEYSLADDHVREIVLLARAHQACVKEEI